MRYVLILLTSFAFALLIFAGIFISRYYKFDRGELATMSTSYAILLIGIIVTFGFYYIENPKK